MVSKAQIELELQTTLPVGYTTDFINTLSDTAESIVQTDCNRTAFTGKAANRYTRAVLCWVVNALVSPAPSLLRGAISSIKEGDSQITFGNGRGISTYSTEYMGLVASLAIRPTSNNYTYTNSSTFYAEEY